MLQKMFLKLIYNLFVILKHFSKIQAKLKMLCLKLYPQGRNSFTSVDGLHPTLP